MTAIADRRRKSGFGKERWFIGTRTDDIDVLDPPTRGERDLILKKPSMYNVVFMNDDYTPMSFVTMLLEKIFDLSHDVAVAIMMEVHTKGKGLVGPYTYEIAETKLYETMRLARAEGFPLRLELEKIE